MTDGGTVPGGGQSGGVEAGGAHTSADLGWTRDGVPFRGRVDVPAAPRARLFLVHGLGEHSGRQQAIVRAMLASGVACARFDLRGHGRSGGKRGDAPSIAALLDDVEAFVAQAAARLPELPSLLYGHSLGGLLVLSLLVRRGFAGRGAIASSPALRTAVPPPRWKILLGRLLRHVAPAATMHNGLDPHGLTRDPDVLRALAQDPLVHQRISARLGLDLLAEGSFVAARRDRLPLPVLLLHGDADRLTDFAASRAFAAQHDEVTFVPFPGGYHELHHDLDRERALATIAAFVTARAAAP